MLKKKLIALGLSAAMVGSLVACGSESSSTGSETKPTTAPTQAGKEDGDDNGLKSAAADHSSVDAGSIVDFEDGAYTFATVNDSDWTKDADAEMSVSEQLGSKVLYMTRPNNGSGTGLAIDVVGLLGDKAADCTKISVDIGINPSGSDFAALSGNLIVYTGETNTSVSQNFSIYKADAACKTVEIDISSSPLVAGASNYLTIGDLQDTGAKPSSIYIDNIICYDASGNPIALNKSVEFAVDGVGSFDWSGTVVKPENEVAVLTPNEVTGGGWWPSESCAFAFQANDSYPSLTDDLGASFGEGDVLTIYYSLTDADVASSTDNMYQWFPYIRAQNWPASDEDGNQLDDDGSGWGYSTIVDVGYDVDQDDDGNNKFIDGSMINESATICQYSFEYVNQKFLDAGAPENWQDYCDFFGIADRGSALKIVAITIGKLPQ